MRKRKRKTREKRNAKEKGDGRFHFTKGGLCMNRSAIFFREREISKRM